MVNVGKCPKCEKVLSFVNIEEVKAKVGSTSDSWRVWEGVSYCCPWCNSILSVQIDPVVLKAHVVNEIIQRLKEEM